MHLTRSYEQLTREYPEYDCYKLYYAQVRLRKHCSLSYVGIVVQIAPSAILVAQLSDQVLHSPLARFHPPTYMFATGAVQGVPL